MNIHTRLHTIGHVFAAATLLINAACAGGSSVPLASSAQQLAQTDVHPVTHHISLTMLFKDKSSFGVLPTQDNAGQCWQPTTLEPMGPSSKQSFALDYDFRCGDSPPALTVLWRKNLAIRPGCEFSFTIEKGGASNTGSFKITTANGDLTCTVKSQISHGGGLIQYGLISN